MGLSCIPDPLDLLTLLGLGLLGFTNSTISSEYRMWLVGWVDTIFLLVPINHCLLL